MFLGGGEAAIKGVVSVSGWERVMISSLGCVPEWEKAVISSGVCVQWRRSCVWVGDSGDHRRGVRSW
jgi:hypothetical protein